MFQFFFLIRCDLRGFFCLFSLGAVLFSMILSNLWDFASQQTELFSASDEKEMVLVILLVCLLA